MTTLLKNILVKYIKSEKAHISVSEAIVPKIWGNILIIIA